MLRKDQFHRPLEDRPRRPGTGREPLIELARLYAEESAELVAPALQVLALLQDARTHLCPSRLLIHRVPASKRRTHSFMVLLYGA